MKRIPVKTYTSVFIATLFIIAISILVSNYINTQKTNDIKNDENKIAIDIFALEAKTDLLNESECKKIDTTSISQELYDLSSRIEFMEKQVGENDPTIFRLKRYFGLLEIKSFIINQKLAKRCEQYIPTIIYLYKSNSNCSECTQEEFVLSALKTKMPDISFYTLDYDHDFPALQSHIQSSKSREEFPTMIINGKNYSGFLSLEQVLEIINTQKIKNNASN